MTDIMPIADIPNGARIVWCGKWATLTETRRHAMTNDDGTVWVVIDDKTQEPTVRLDIPVVVDTVFS